MAVAHVASLGSVRGEVADAEDQAFRLRQELDAARREASDAHRAGAVLLNALEASMAPLMLEVAAARRALIRDLAAASEASGVEGLELAGLADGCDSQNPCAELEAEIRHLTLDIDHYRRQAEELQAEERQRAHELRRVRAEVADLAESLTYEKKLVKHHEVCNQLGCDGSGGWVGLGPTGVGKRTMEVRAERKLRKAAEQRQGRLSRDVARLANDTTTQQATIQDLSRRLEKVRSAVQEREQKLVDAGLQTAALQTKLKRADRLSRPTLKPDADQSDPLHELGEEDSAKGAEEAEIAATASSVAASLGTGGGKMKKKKNSSTGKLPQLSF